MHGVAPIACAAALDRIGGVGVAGEGDDRHGARRAAGGGIRLLRAVLSGIAGAQADDRCDGGKTVSGDATQPGRHAPAARQARRIDAAVIDAALVGQIIDGARQIGDVVRIAGTGDCAGDGRHAGDVPDEPLIDRNAGVGRGDDEAVPIRRLRQAGRRQHLLSCAAAAVQQEDQRRRLCGVKTSRQVDLHRASGAADDDGLGRARLSDVAGAGRLRRRAEDHQPHQGGEQTEPRLHATSSPLIKALRVGCFRHRGQP